ncbi:MAG: hypothetical protein GY910_15835 [bacterium]|nr:hypothetical protein [Deltaproteobacteria bacterium]MCP4906445.1 hypothetical protein [bacterium]
MDCRGRFLVFWMGVMVGVFATGGAVAGDSFEARDAEIMRVLDRYMNALNDLDLEGHVATYHFPHYRHASGKIVVWQSVREAIPDLDLPAEERRTALRAILEPDWHRSEWTHRDIVQGDREKVHVVTRFVRMRADGSEIRSFDSLYVMTLEAGRWGIKGRSSFAP